MAAALIAAGLGENGFDILPEGGGSSLGGVASGDAGLGCFAAKGNRDLSLSIGQRDDLAGLINRGDLWGTAGQGGFQSHIRGMAIRFNQRHKKAMLLFTTLKIDSFGRDDQSGGRSGRRYR